MKISILKHLQKCSPANLYSSKMDLKYPLKIFKVSRINLNLVCYNTITKTKYQNFISLLGLISKSKK